MDDRSDARPLDARSHPGHRLRTLGREGSLERPPSWGSFPKLARGTLDADTLRQRVGVHPRGARDFFDTLVALHMLERHDGLYSNTPETDYYEDPARMKLYLGAMTGLSMAANQAIAREFPWANYRSFSDIGTAQGGLAVQVALAHPHVVGIGVDFAPVRPAFQEYIPSFGLDQRLRFEGADYRTDPLPAVDVSVMGHILHNEDRDGKRELIAKAYATLPPDGVLLVHEALIDDERRVNTFGLLLSLHMLVATPGGFDYTGAECCRWMREAGFRETSVKHLVGPDSMVLARK
jgi:cyclopropane fatty-acyl-phospholipid synthase-like methyltransferase